MIIFFDTETSAYWRGDVPPSDDGQALPVEIALMMETPEGRLVNVVSTFLARTGWARRNVVMIEQRCVDKHGITEEMCDLFGEPPIMTMLRLQKLFAMATLVVGHNVSFDIGVMDAAFAAMDLPPLVWPPHFCTMRESTNIVKMESKRLGVYKYPKLAEAYFFFTGRTLPGAHAALVDVQACRAVYKGIQRHRATAMPPVPPGAVAPT